MFIYVSVALSFLVFTLAVALALTLNQKAAPKTEPRLLGSWISDADRTLEMMASSANEDSETLGQTEQFFGKLKITFSTDEVVIELDGQIDRSTYQVLASDEYSCVIQQTDGPSGIDQETSDIVRLSSFTVFHFEETDSCWVQSQYGGYAEYFRSLPDESNHLRSTG